MLYSLFSIYKIYSQNTGSEWNQIYGSTTNNAKDKTCRSSPLTINLLYFTICIHLSCLFKLTFPFVSTQASPFSISLRLYFNLTSSSCRFSNPFLQTGACLAETLAWQLSNISLGHQGPGVFYLQHGQSTSTKKQQDYFPRRLFLCAFRNALQISNSNDFAKDVASPFCVLELVLRSMGAMTAPIKIISANSFLLIVPILRQSKPIYVLQ